MIQHVYRSVCKVPLIIARFFFILESYRHIFEKYLNTQFYKNPPRASRVVTWGQTDRHDPQQIAKRA